MSPKRVEVADDDPGPFCRPLLARLRLSNSRLAIVVSGEVEVDNSSLVVNFPGRALHFTQVVKCAAKGLPNALASARKALHFYLNPVLLIKYTCYLYSVAQAVDEELPADEKVARSNRFASLILKLSEHSSCDVFDAHFSRYSLALPLSVRLEANSSPRAKPAFPVVTDGKAFVRFLLLRPTFPLLTWTFRLILSLT